MANTFRWATLADADALAHIRGVVYESGSPDPNLLMTEPDEVAAIGFCDGKPAAQFKVMSMNISRGLAQIPAGGVAAVAVLPEYRGTGIGKEMMTWSLRAMRENGQEIAALYPFRGTYYRQFGYETAGRRWMIDVARDRMPKFDAELPARQISREELPLLNSALEGYARMHSGVNLRTADNWKRRMGRNFPMVYAVGDPVEAYCWTRLDGGFWDPVSVGELVWSTPRGYRSILAFLRSLGVNRGNIQWHESSLSPFLNEHLDQGVAPTLYRPVMWRILDLKKAFERLRPDSAGYFCVGVTDELVAENNGSFSIQFSPEGVFVSSGGTPDFCCGIGVLTTAFLGEPSLSDLALGGSVQVHNETGFESAKRLLLPSPTICPDFF